jgi:hypothetical protein
MTYSINVPNAEKDGWLTLEKVRIETDLQTGDYLKLSRDESKFLGCSDVLIIGRRIAFGNVDLYCRPTKNMHPAMMAKAAEK